MAAQRQVFELKVLGQPSVYYTEVAEKSPVYSFADGQSSAERTYVVPWEDRDRFVAGMLGFPRIGFTRGLTRANAPDDTFVARQTPHAMLDFIDPGKRGRGFVDAIGGAQPTVPADEEEQPNALQNPDGTWLYARAVTRMEGLEPLGDCDPVTTVPRYNYAVCTVRYEAVTFRILTDRQLISEGGVNRSQYFLLNPDTPPEYTMQRYITRTARPVMEYLALPRGRMHWTQVYRRDAAGKDLVGNFLARTPAPPLVADRGTVDYASAYPSPSTEFIYTWHQVPFVPEAAFRHVGKVNLTDFNDGHQTFRAGTLLLLGCELKPYRTGSGKFVLDVQYRIKYFEPFPDSTRPARGHNYFLRYKNDVSLLYFEKISTRGIGDVLDAHPEYSREVDRSLFDYADFLELFSWHINPAPAVSPVKPL